MGLKLGLFDGAVVGPLVSIPNIDIVGNLVGGIFENIVGALENTAQLNGIIVGDVIMGALVGLEVVGLDVVGLEVVGLDVVGLDVVGRAVVGLDVVGRAVVGLDVTGRAVFDWRIVFCWRVGLDVAGLDVVGRDVVGRDVTGRAVFDWPIGTTTSSVILGFLLLTGLDVAVVSSV